MIDECVCQREVTDALRSLVAAPPAQVLDGLLIGFSDLTALCTACQAELQEGMDVTVYAYRCTGAGEWSVARCHCLDCASDRIRSPTLGATEILATARLGVRSFYDEQTHWLCLNDVHVETLSPPTEGTEP